MNQPRVAGGPLGVARTHRPLRPRSRDASRGVKAVLAAIAVAVPVFAGAAIVEALAVSSFGLIAGTAIAVLAATVMGIAYLALRPGQTRLGQCPGAVRSRFSNGRRPYSTQPAAGD
jgi:hypothetical protein